MFSRRAVLPLLLLASCDQLTSKLSPKPQKLKSSDGSLEITVPGSWSDDSSPARKLNDQAVLQASNRVSELYVIVLSEAKEDLSGMDLKQFSEITRSSQIKSMTEGVQEGPVERDVNGMPALEFVLRGTVDKANVVMKHVAVEGPKHFHQVLVWTLKSKWEKEKAGLDAVVMSLKDAGAAAGGARAPAPAPAAH